MTVKMTNSEVEGVSVVELDGRIVLGEESNSLREKLKSLIAEGKKKIVLNMANIKCIDSAGLGILVAAHLSAKTLCASATWARNSRRSCK
jgi:anti-anti-sigma factor